VDNDLSVNPLDAWKTTGKPPAIYDHVHSTDLLIYQDICGPIGFVKRVCNLNGNVVSGGDHDHAEANSGLIPGTAEREAWHGMLSPTVNLRNGGPPYVFPNAPGPANAMDIDNDVAATTEDYYVFYDIYTGVMDPFTKGVLWRFGFTHYPCRQSDNIACWGDMRYPGFIIFNPDKQCFLDFEGDKQNGLGVWRAALAEGGAAYPDSIKMYLGTRQECYRFGVVAGCSSTDGTYWDNVSMAFIDGEVPPVTIDIWQFINDTFTVNGLNRNVSAVNTAAFDTTAALVKTGLNISQAPGTLLRYDIPGDTTALNAAGGNLRVDMISVSIRVPATTTPSATRRAVCARCRRIRSTSPPPDRTTSGASTWRTTVVAARAVRPWASPLKAQVLVIRVAPGASTSGTARVATRLRSISGKSRDVLSVVCRSTCLPRCMTSTIRSTRRSASSRTAAS